MGAIYNDVFRMVNLRGSATEVAVEPEPNGDENGDGGPVIEMVRSGELEFGAATAPQLEELFREHADLIDSASTSGLGRLTDELRKKPTLAPDSKVAWDDGEVPLAQISRTASFEKDYKAALNAWLLFKYGRRRDLQQFEDQLRVGEWLKSVARSPAATPPLRALLRKPVSIPRPLRAAVTEKRLKKRPVWKPAKKEAVPAAAYDEEERQIAEVNTIMERIGDALLARSIDQSQPASSAAVAGKPRTGFLAKLGQFIFGSEPVTATEPPPGPAVISLDAALVGDVRNSLTEHQAELFDGVLANLPAQPRLGAVLSSLGSIKSTAIDLANTHFDLVWHDRYQPTLPPGEQDPLPTDDGAVQALGWGDLIVARETLINYEAREIAHIENVLPNERKNRQHERRHSVEDVVETEVEEREEAERELETTDRHELQSESNSVIAEEFAIRAGVNTSGRYGLTKVETSLDAGFTRSTSEARSSTLNVAKEIVSKAVERTFRAVRELRRRTTVTEIIETNQHEIDNVPKNGGGASAISGIYRWVEKVHEVQLRHYGTRMMVEFSVPEPALSVLGLDRQIEVDVQPPDPLNLSASDITEGNYLALARKYEAVGIKPPPDILIDVGFAWASQSDEAADENKSEDVISQLIAIPDQYRPIGGQLAVSAHPAKPQFFQVRFQIGDKQMSRNGEASFSQWFSLGGTESWPGGVPVSMTAHGHFDKTMSLNVMFVCIRRKAALRQWQIATFEAILAGFQRMLKDYNDAVAAAQLEEEIAGQIRGQHSSVNRRTEREELQKWSTKILRRNPFDLDAIVSEGTDASRHDEVDPVRADQQAPLIRFYEGAFEWDNMSYFFYPYFWGRRRAWHFRQALRHDDYRFETFLRAGAARVIVPVTPGYEARVLFYLANPDLAESDRIEGPEDLSPTDEPPPSIEESIYNTLWLELMLDKNEELALGSGFLAVTNGSTNVTVVESIWQLSERDIGRELFIAGERYEIAEIIDETQFALTEAYTGSTDPRAAYATGSVPFGPPWLVNLPTTLVVLDANRSNVGV